MEVEPADIRGMSVAYGLSPGSVPFLDEPWRGEDAAAARAFWEFKNAIAEASPPALDGTDRRLYFESQYHAVISGEPVSLLPEFVVSTARRYATTDRQRQWLAQQVHAADVLSRPSVRFERREELNGFIAVRAVPHAMLLADLVSASRGFQQPQVEALAEAFFLHGRLVETKRDLGADRLYFEVDDLESAGIRPGDLLLSPPPEAVRRVVWRRIVRIRDAFARGMPLAGELHRSFARTLRTSVLLSLEILNAIERGDYDLGSFEPGLSRYHRAQAYIQARFGRTPWR